MVFDQNRDGGTRFFGGGYIQQKGKVQTDPQFCHLVGYPNLPTGKTLMKVVDLLTVMILKSVSEYISFKAKYLQHVKLKMKKR